MTLQQFVSYRTMGGWLRAFYVINIVSIVISAISLISLLLTGSNSIRIGAITRESFLLSFVSGILSTAITVAMVVFLGKRDKKSITFFVAGSIVGILTTTISMFIQSTDPARLAAYYQSLGMDASMVATTSTATSLAVVFQIIFSIAWAIGWFIYFQKSNRVRVYFSNDHEFNQEYIAMRAQWEQQQEIIPPQ